ncbi:MAG: helix-turn-helix transcriptional regulator [Deltaproteobacteria bacterium]|nr:helix-turn-helix transcriptional regulator [Deltaproteobacteria bacterium]
MAATELVTMAPCGRRARMIPQGCPGWSSLVHGSSTLGNALVQALDAMSIGVLFFGSDGGIIHGNSMAHRALRTIGPLDCASGSLASRLKQMTLLRGSETYSLDRDGRAPLGLVLVPTHEATLTPSGPVVSTIGYLVDPEEGPSMPNDGLIQAVYGLTPVEARIALLLADGHSPRQIGSIMSSSYATVRTHLLSVYKKTSTDRQASLVRLLLGLGSGALGP